MTVERVIHDALTHETTKESVVDALIDYVDGNISTGKLADILGVSPVRLYSLRDAVQGPADVLEPTIEQQEIVGGSTGGHNVDLSASQPKPANSSGSADGGQPSGPAHSNRPRGIVATTEGERNMTLTARNRLRRRGWWWARWVVGVNSRPRRPGWGWSIWLVGADSRLQWIATRGHTHHRRPQYVAYLGRSRGWAWRWHSERRWADGYASALSAMHGAERVRL